MLRADHGRPRGTRPRPRPPCSRKDSMTRRSSDDWRALLNESHDVEQLSIELTWQAAHNGAVDGQLQRRYLVRRAALADRAETLQRETGSALAGEVDAALAALGLLHWDREHAAPAAGPSRRPTRDGTSTRCDTSTRNTPYSSSTTRSGPAADDARQGDRPTVERSRSGAPPRSSSLPGATAAGRGRQAVVRRFGLGRRQLRPAGVIAAWGRDGRGGPGSGRRTARRR